MNIKPKVASISAALGSIAWLSMVFTETPASNETEFIKRILLLGVLTIVPLGLSLIARFKTENAPLAFQFAVLLQPFAAAAVFISFFLAPGVLAGGIAGLWLIVTVLVAVFGLHRLRSKARPVEEICIDAGLVYLPVGAASLMLSRLGIQPLGFGDTLVLLAAVHFHFAGFAAPLLAGFAGRSLPANQVLRGLFRTVVVAIITGTPLVAVGITVSPAVALAGALAISLGLFLLALLVAGWVVPLVKSIPAQILLLISSASTLPAMTFACIYAYSVLFKKLLIDIPQMAMTHGVINAFGFVLCGLIAWTIVDFSAGRRS